MKTLTFLANERDEWLATRRGKITGSRIGKLYSKRDQKNKLADYYELVCEMLGLPPKDDENPMVRGSRLETDAIERFEQETGITVDKSLIIWTRDDNESIAVSPDGIIGDTEAVEAKCLDSGKHLKAYLTKKIPDEYDLQVLQYFIVNDKLQKLHFVFFDPRVSMFTDPEGPVAKLEYFEITVTRREVEGQIEGMLTYEREVIAEAKELVNKLTF
jgi:putative phage-type endonuclease